MMRMVELPLWLLLLILAFAAVTFASHFLLPSVRWFFRRRAERLVARLNRRLTRPIQPFKLARRFDTIQRLIYDPEVALAIAEHARREGVPEAVAFQRARAYAREIVPSFSASAYFGIGTRLARWLSQGLYRVRLGHYSEAELTTLDPEATVVFVLNHRSNMDYVLVTFMVAERTSLSYAVGEWARIWPLSMLIRSMGAYFIRRDARNALYRKVLARYVQMATEAGVTQAVFPEGGLSLDGSVGPAKLGILSYILAARTQRDVVFVPVAFNYDRVLEDRFLIAAARSGQRRFHIRLLRTGVYALRRGWQLARGNFLRYGYAAVSFGPPLSLQRFRDGRGGALAGPVAEELMARIRTLVPVLPVPLLCKVLVDHGPLARAALEAAFAALVERLRSAGAHVQVPRGSVTLALRLAREHLALRGLVTDGEVTAIVEPNRALVAYYANSIAHLLPAPAAAPQVALRPHGA
jgi:glycerol-3-phosphate O-acyltransferase